MTVEETADRLERIVGNTPCPVESIVQRLKWLRPNELPEVLLSNDEHHSWGWSFPPLGESGPMQRTLVCHYPMKERGDVCPECGAVYPGRMVAFDLAEALAADAQRIVEP